jgi:hypothetical protein
MDKGQTAKVRRAQFKKLLAASTLEQQKRIKAGQKAGRLLRKQVEKL